MISDLFLIEERRPYWVLFRIMTLIFVLGFCLDRARSRSLWSIVAALDFELPTEQVMIWFAIALAVNLQTLFLAPTVWLREVLPARDRTRSPDLGDLLRGQIATLLLVILFSALVLTLPMSAR